MEKHIVGGRLVIHHRDSESVPCSAASDATIGPSHLGGASLDRNNVAKCRIDRTTRAYPATIEALAAMVAGNEGYPGWLERALQRAVTAAAHTVQDEMRDMSRTDLRQQLEVLRMSGEHIVNALTATGTVKRALDSVTRNDAGAGAQSAYLEEDRELCRSLALLRARVDKALDANPKVSNRPVDKSPPRSARLVCAMYISAVWNAIRGETPGRGSAAANLACEGLWRLAGGADRIRTVPAEGWKSQIEDASAELATHDGKRIWRVLGVECQSPSESAVSLACRNTVEEKGPD